jgi:hypothetical protein
MFGFGKPMCHNWNWISRNLEPLRQPEIEPGTCARLKSKVKSYVVDLSAIKPLLWFCSEKQKFSNQSIFAL